MANQTARIKIWYFEWKKILRCNCLYYLTSLGHKNRNIFARRILFTFYNFFSLKLLMKKKFEIFILSCWFHLKSKHIPLFYRKDWDPHYYTRSPYERPLHKRTRSLRNESKTKISKNEANNINRFYNKTSFQGL